MLENFKPHTLESVQQLKLDPVTFKTVLSENIVLITKAFRNQMVIPAFETFCENITEIYNTVSYLLVTLRRISDWQLGKL